MSRWVENLRRGSPGTADVYLRRLGAICQRVGKTPTQLADLDEGAAYRLLLDFVTSEEKRGATGSFISHSVTVARSWLTHNGKPQVRRIKIRAPDSAPTLQDERVPEQAELRRVLLAAPAQWRAAASVMAFGGARPEVLGNYLGTDGLRLRDLPDLRLSGTTVAFERMPARVDVRPELSKAGHKYLTFLGTEACGYIVEYLAERLRAGESLDRNSDLIHPLRAPKPFIRAVNIGDGVRSAIRRAGFPWRPYVLRAYFDTQLLLAESKGKIAHDYRVFWMGHKGSMEARYTTNKGRLPESLLDDMRESYRRAEPFLATQLTGDEREKGNLWILRALLKDKGYTEEEVAQMDLELVDERQLDALLSARRSPSRGPFQPTGRRTVLSGGPAESGRGAHALQQVIAESELPSYLAGGWIARMALNGSKFIVERS